MDKYYVEPNLCRWAMIHFASHLWKRPDLKKHLAKFSLQPLIDPKQTMPNVLHTELDKLILYSMIKDELKFAIGSMGTRIRKFLKKIASSYDNKCWVDYIDYVDHIHWSHLGCIDITRTNQSLYTSGLLPMNHQTWLWLRNHCAEKCIIDFWNKISTITEYAELRDKIRSRDCYWTLRVFFVQNNKIDIIEYMLENSEQEYYQMLTYFWHCLDDGGKKFMLWKIANSTMTRYGHNWLTDGWESDIDTFMFIIRQYSIYKFEEILIEMMGSPTVIAAMLMWPCQDNFIPVFKEACKNYGSIDCVPILSKLSDLMCLQRTYIGHDLSAKRLLFNVLADGNIVNHEMIMKSFGNICLVADVPLLKYIIIRAKSPEEREKYLDFIFEFYTDFKSEILHEFLQEIVKDSLKNLFLKKSSVKIYEIIEKISQCQ